MPVPPQGLGSRSSAMIIGVLFVAAASATAAWLGRRWAAERRADSEARSALEEVARGKARAAGVAMTEVVGDDLKVIEGIGPRVEAVLHGASIDTFERLAGMRPGRLETILREAGGRMTNPRSWPRQARLAADGRWADLRRLHDQLDRGAARTSA